MQPPKRNSQKVDYKCTTFLACKTQIYSQDGRGVAHLATLRGGGEVEPPRLQTKRTRKGPSCHTIFPPHPSLSSLSLQRQEGEERVEFLLHERHVTTTMTPRSIGDTGCLINKTDIRSTFPSLTLEYVVGVVQSTFDLSSQCWQGMQVFFSLLALPIF